MLETIEQTRIFELETIIETGLKTFVDVGNALAEIRDRKLYRDGYKTFEDYCRDRWEFSKQRAYQLMNAAGVIGVLEKSTIVDFYPRAEIKRDGKFRETGNLYIETAEKSHPDKYEFIPSGIMRQDNSWLFVIGDEKTIYIFSTKYLRMLVSRYRKVEKPTSRGVLMPIQEADKYCIRKIDISPLTPFST